MQTCENDATMNESKLPLTILYADEDLIAVDKPNDLFVHQTNLDRRVRDSVTDRLRSQLKQAVYPLHRLDRPTSGCLLFGRHKECVRAMSYLFTERQIEKSYIALVRGHLDPIGCVDYPLNRKNKSQKQSAITGWRVRRLGEIDHAIPPHESARYSLVELFPRTGRWHQLRRHCAHIRHPIIGDTSHGDARHNRLFRTLLSERRLMLHASQLHFEHPLKKGKVCTIHSPPPQAFVKLYKLFDWSRHTDELSPKTQLIGED